MSNQEGVVSGARKLHDGFKFAIVSDQADFHNAIRQHLPSYHEAPSHARTGDEASTKRSIRGLFA